jgi:hypothetical protein
MFRIFVKNKFLLLFLLVICLPQIAVAFPISYSEIVTISATVVDPTVGCVIDCNGGGGVIPTMVTFRGNASPNAKVFILKDGQIAAQTIADGYAHFSVTITGLTTNTYTFSVYSEDKNNSKSSFFSFPILITSGTDVNINNIFLSPSINIDKIEVKKGNNLAIFGESIPLKEVVVSLYLGQEYLYNIFSDNLGSYLLNLNTTNLDIGKYRAKVKSISNGKESLYSTPVSFVVGAEDTSNDNISCLLLRGDLNCDNHVNLTDFSIMAYWYKKVNPPQKVDLNGDGIISLVDFSIMAFNWTG